MVIFHDQNSMIKYFINNGYQISKSAIEFVMSESIDPADLICYISKDQPQLIVITEKSCIDYMKNRNRATQKGNNDSGEDIEISLTRPPESITTVVKPVELKIIPQVNNSSGKIGDFTSYYRDRFRKISDILVTNFKLINADSKTEIITDFSQFQGEGGSIDTKYLEECFIAVGMICRISEYKDSIVIYLQGEGNPGVIRAKWPKKSSREGKLRDLPLGIVIGIKGKVHLSEQRTKKDKIPLISIDKIIFPNTVRKSEAGLKTRKFKQLILPISNTALTCRKSEDGENERLLRFKMLINSIIEYNNTHRQEEITAILISGNFINTHYSDIAIYDQYQSLIELLEKIPSLLTIIIPGEQDFTRWILPKTRLNKKYLPVNTEKFYFFDNPAYFSLANRVITVYYDRSTMEITDEDERVEYMVKLLRFRHLCPRWSNISLPIATSPIDHLVMMIQPDIFVFGSAKNCITGRYKSTKLVVPIEFDSIFTGFTKESGETVLDLTTIDLYSLKDHPVSLKIH